MMNDARRKGITGVPFIVIDERWAVSGGQTAKVYSEVGCRVLSCFFFSCVSHGLAQIFKKLAATEKSSPRPQRQPAAPSSAGVPPATGVPVTA